MIPENIVSNMIDFLLMDLIVPELSQTRDDKVLSVSQEELRRREKAAMTDLPD